MFVRSYLRFHARAATSLTSMHVSRIRVWKRIFEQERKLFAGFDKDVPVGLVPKAIVEIVVVNFSDQDVLESIQGIPVETDARPFGDVWPHLSILRVHNIDTQLRLRYLVPAIEIKATRLSH